VRRPAAGRAAIIGVIAGLAITALPAAEAQGTLPAVPPALLVPPPVSPDLARTLDPVIDALWSRFSRRSAMGHVVYISQFWRLSGNLGYDATINRVHARLLAAGFQDRTPPGAATSSTWVEEYPNAGKGWRYTVGTLALEHGGAPEEILLSREQTNLAVCINSFSTAPGGVVLPLVDVGSGDKDEDYAGKTVKDSIVLGAADPVQLWRHATARGARGIISTSLGAYVSPDRPGAVATPREEWSILQWGSIPYDDVRKGFAFKATPRAAAALRHALAHDSHTTVRAEVASTFSTKPNRLLVAEIPGRVAPKERVVITAHVQEPGANDNASGVATLTEMARAMRAGIRAGAIPQPDRTITFLWLEEISGSREWLKDHAEDAKSVRYMFSMDMTGENTRKTGGTFLIERWPDPGAVWDRPWDPHTEWGRSEVKAETLKGDLINDLHLAICGRVSTRTGWVVKTNPYEGGSDHTVFGEAGIPAVLDWHFTDRYYHTNLDTADKTSPSEMRNVGVSVAATAWILASTGESTALAVAQVVARAGTARVAIEEGEGAKIAAAESDRSRARLRQDQIVQAWKKWYGEAVRSAVRLVTGPPSPTLTRRLDELAESFMGSI
jgi:aminopeptidase YwaD